MLANLLNSRFLLDAPESELGNSISLCFLTELAYWFYLDEYAEEDDSLNNIKFDPFAQQLLNVSHLLVSTVASISLQKTLVVYKITNTVRLLIKIWLMTILIS